jgi:hypothetical protein
MKMPAPNGILSIYGDIIVSYNCESDTINLAKVSACKASATVMVAQAAKIDQILADFVLEWTEIQMPPQGEA